jgi:cyclic pyranopterin phosphate synthase
MYAYPLSSTPHGHHESIMNKPVQSSEALTHIDEQGRARMVDIGTKAVTRRKAVAQGFVTVSEALAYAIQSNAVAKGNVFEVARIAGIQAAKRTDELIPLCHSLPLDSVDVTLELQGCEVMIRAEACTTWKTGVEMEALTAVSVAALTVIDMGKAIDKSMTIHGVRLIEKTGGKSGRYLAGGLKS